MIKVTAIQDKDVQRAVCGMCGIEYDADTMAYEAQDGETGEVLAAAQFTLSAGGVGVLESLGAADISEKAEAEFTKDGILFITGRAAMNFMDLAGFHTAVASGWMTANDERRGTSKRLGFRSDESGVWSCDLSRMFTGEKH